MCIIILCLGIAIAGVVWASCQYCDWANEQNEEYETNQKKLKDEWELENPPQKDEEESAREPAAEPKKE